MSVLLRIVIAQVATVPISVPFAFPYQLVAITVVTIAVTVAFTFPHLRRSLRTQAMGQGKG